MPKMLAALSLVIATAAHAADDARPPENLVRFQAEASREVPNDLMTASLRVEVEGRDPVALAESANRAMAAALETARAHPAVKARTGNYQTHPLRDREQRIVGWRVTQELRLESRDFKQTAALVGKLQGSLRVSGMGFAVSPEARAAAEDALIAEAVEAFRRRAELVRKSFGADGYRLQEAHVATAGGIPLEPRLRMAEMAMAAAPPALEAGESRITVTVQGAILLEGRGR